MRHGQTWQRHRRRNGAKEAQERAARLMREGGYEEAIRALVPAMETAPNDPNVLGTAGAVYSRLGNTDEARRALRHACGARRSGCFPFVALAAVECRAGRIESAVEAINAGIAKYPRSVHVRTARAQLAIRRGERASKVRMMMQEANALPHGENAELLHAWALFEKSKGKVGDARSLLRRALNVKRGHAQSWLALGMLEVRANGNSAGRDVLREGVRSGHGVGAHAPLLAAWANLEEKLGNRRTAMWLFRNASTGKSHFSQRTLFQWALFMRRGPLAWEKKFGKRLLEQIVQNFPNDIHSKHALAMVCDRDGDVDEAEKLYRASIAIDKGSVISWFGLGLLLMSRGDVHGAQQAFLGGTGRQSIDELLSESATDDFWADAPIGDSAAREYRISPSSSPSTPSSSSTAMTSSSSLPRMSSKHERCVDKLALIACDRGDIETARALYRLASSLDASGTSALYHWALLEKNQDNCELAGELFAQCALLNPSKPLTFLNWGLMERRRGNLEQAVQLFKRGVKARPTSAPIWISWAVTESSRGDVARARHILTKGLQHCGSVSLPMWSELAMVELRLNGPQKAVEVLEEAVTRAPAFGREEDFLALRESLKAQLYRQQEKGIGDAVNDEQRGTPELV